MVEARHPDKAPDAFRTISEVADELELPQHVLRFWETKFTHIRPVKRAGGRRYYRREDVDLLRGIRRLLYSEGYTIKGVQKILKEQGVRHVQAVGFDDGPPEFGAPPATRRAEPDTAPMHTDEGAGFGGLLGGLLPRRKGRAVEEAREMPEPDEPPLPFPDFANFTPRTEEPVPPPRPRPQARASEPRQAPQRSEPAFDEPDAPRASRPTPRQPRQEPDAYEEPRVDPVFDAAPRRPEPRPDPRPMPRPSRGPASRIPDRSGAPEMDDPLLPFFEDPQGDDPVSEPLDARIRRLKDGVYSPAPFENGPPSEFVPKRARRAAPPPPVDEDEDDILDDYHAVPPPRAPRPPQPRGDVPDVHGELPFGAPSRASRQESRQEPPMAAPSRAEPRYRPEPPPPARHEPAWGEEDDDETEIWDDEDAPIEEPRPRGRDYRGLPPDASSHAPHAPIPAAPPPPSRRQDQMRQDPYAPRPAERQQHDMRSREWHERDEEAAYARHRAERDRAHQPPPPLRAQRAEPQDSFFDPPERPAPPLGGTRRVGPLLGPLEEYEPEDFEPDAPPPTRPVTERRGMAAEPPRAHRPDSWDEEEGYLPPEPNRPGPPEQYLPPHLRSEPRMSGQPQPPAPVLTREDIARLQSALFELAECRRLIAGLGVPRTAPDSET